MGADLATLSRTLLRAGLDAWPDLIKYWSRWWFQRIFIFHLYLGKMNPIWLYNIFQRGWFNHQLVFHCQIFVRISEHMAEPWCSVFFLDGWPRFGRIPSKKMFRNIWSIIFEIIGRRVLPKFGRNLFVFGKVLYNSYTLTNGSCVEGIPLRKHHHLRGVRSQPAVSGRYNWLKNNCEKIWVLAILMVRFFGMVKKWPEIKPGSFKLPILGRSNNRNL